MSGRPVGPKGRPLTMQERRQRWVAKMLEAGRCVSCGGPARRRGRRCRACGKRHAAQERARRAKAPAAD